MGAIVALSILTVGCGYVSDASSTVFNETKASTLLSRYETFKEMYAALEAKKASLNAFKTKIDSLNKSYGDTKPQDWNREDRLTLAQWSSELDGLKASYNGLAAEYNAMMAKENYDFTNVGKLPKGASDPLPREVAAYIEN